SLVFLFVLMVLSACMKKAASPSSEGEILSDDGTFVLRPVRSGLSRPVGLSFAPGVKGKVYVIEQEGRIQELNISSKKFRTVLDLTDRVHSAQSEQGLLGLAFHPDFPD